MTFIRRYRESDWPVIWPLLRATFEAGDTDAFDPQSTEAEIHMAWVEIPSATYVACPSDGRILGTYVLKPNRTQTSEGHDLTESTDGIPLVERPPVASSSR